MADGSYTAALRLLQHAGNDLFPEVKKWFNGLFTNNGVELVKFAEEWSKAGREQQKNLLRYVLQLLEQSIRAAYLPHIQPALPDEEAAFVQKLAGQKLPLQAQQNMIKHLADTSYFIERNAHSKTQLLALSIKLVYAIKGRKLPDEH
jgi:DNA polymerase-3 subunit delta'